MINRIATLIALSAIITTTAQAQSTPPKKNIFTEEYQKQRNPDSQSSSKAADNSEFAKRLEDDESKARLRKIDMITDRADHIR